MRSDIDLVESTRSGDNEAFGELWERHRKAALKAARSLTKDHDPEDMAQEAFLRILMAIRNDGGPREVFRPYLYSVLRSISMGWKSPYGDTQDLEVLESIPDPAGTFEGRVIDKAITGRAFASLRPEWRTVLWYSEVEGMNPRDIAPILGMTANATAALTYRAREGLRASWLQAHLNDASADENCQWTVQRLGKYNRNSLGRRERDRVQEHLATCLKCSILVEEVDSLGRNLGIMLLPIFLGTAGMALNKTLAASSLGTPAIDPTGLVSTTTTTTKGAALSGHFPGASMTKIGLLTAALAVGGFVAVAALNATPDVGTAVTAPTLLAPGPTLPTSDPETPAATSALAKTTPPTRTPEVSTPTLPPIMPVQPVDTAVLLPEAVPPVLPVNPIDTQTPTQKPTPTAPPTIPPTTAPPTKPSGPLELPVITSVEERRLFLPLVSGTGIPGATVHLIVNKAEVATTTVGIDGTWSATPEVAPEREGAVRVTAYQSHDGLTSGLTAPSEPVTIYMPTFISLDTTGTTPQVTFSGPTGATVEALLDGKSTGTFHEMTGQPITRTIPASGARTLTLRFVDPATGLRGASLNIELVLP